MVNLEGKILYVISDLHIGDKSSTDNFCSVEKRFIDFLEYIESIDNSVLIFNGDTFEFWQSSMADVFNNNYNLLSKIIKYKTIFIVGNHDYELLSLSKLPIESEFLKKICTEIILDFGTKKIKIVHGNEFDKFNSSINSAFTGKMMALLVAMLEYKMPGSGVESWVRKNIEPIARKIVTLPLHLYNLLFVKKKYSEQRLDIILDNYHKEHLNEVLVCGHTHIPGWWYDYYVNSGTWQEEEEEDKEPHYIKIKPDGETTLHHWPNNSIVTSQAMLYGYMSEEFIKSVWENKNKK